mmetsp:Transcript_23807/g.52049  ORF Transcript_23807/g.52049 Transcript_23807/m.52049 type:complete len:526 (-) Transcript_23807:446-2023(-)
MEGSEGAAVGARLSSLDVVLDELLGKGSYGMVYSAKTKLHGQVAVKVLPWAPNEVSSDLKKELRLLQKCDSDYIVRAHGMFLKPRELWIVMELCDLGSLLDVMRSIDLPLVEEAIAAACHDALKGLEYLHGQKRGIIHRDIKCANLLLSSDGVVKLADFGVAAQLNSTASKRSSVIGTPHWMAPEVIQNGKYDARADVWSLGITAMEMAQMHPPLYDVRPVLKVMFAIASADPPGLDEPDKFSQTFRDFVCYALKKEAAKRPSSSELLQHDFLNRASVEIGGAPRESLKALIARAQHEKAHPRPKQDAPNEPVETGTLMPEPEEGGGGDVDGTLCVKDTLGGIEAEDSGGGTFCMRGTVSADGGNGTLRAGANAPAARTPQPLGPENSDASEDYQTAQAGALDDIDVVELQRAIAFEKAPAPVAVVARSHSDDALFERTLSRFAATPSNDVRTPRGGRPFPVSPVPAVPPSAFRQAASPAANLTPVPRAESHENVRRRGISSRVRTRSADAVGGDVDQGTNCVVS